MDITIITTGVHACTTTWDDPQMALAWLRVVTENISQGSFFSLLSHLGADNDQMDNARQMITYCMGTGA